MNDIKIQKETGHTFNESNEIPPLIPDSLPLIISYVDKDERLRYCNSKYEQWFVLSLDDIRGRPLIEVLGRQTYDSVKKQIELALSGYNVSCKTEVRLRNGELRHSQWDFVPHRDGGSDVCGCYLYVTDITVRRQNEQKLLLISKAVESTGDAIGMSDSRGHHFYHNKAFTDLFEYTPEELEAAGGLPAVYADQDIARNVFKNIMSGESWVGEVAMASKRGRRFPVFLRADSIKDDAGNIIGLIGIHTDITVRKGVGEVLRDTEQRFRNIFDNAMDGISLFDIEARRISSGNKMFCQMLGYSLEEIRVLKIKALHPKEEWPYIEKVLEKMVRGEIVQGKEIPFKRKDGSILYADINVNSATWGGKAYLVGIFRDVTDSKKAEQELRESEERFRMLLEQVPNIAVQGYGPDGTIHYWNQANESIYGYAENEAIGSNLMELIIPPEMRDFVRAAIAKGAQTGEMPPPGELKLMRKDGSLVDVFSSHAIVQRPGHEPIMFCLDVDITERKKTEKKLKRHQKQLRENWKDLQKLAGRLILNQEEELKWLARELHDDLSQRLAVMSIDAGNICQQFKELPEWPLQGILNIKEQLVIMAKDVHNLSRELHPSIIDDLGLVRAVEWECDSFSTRMGIAVMFTPKNISDKIPVDISLCIYRIIQECLSNIAKHANTKNAYVFLECSNNSILLTVRDTGKGFDYAQVRKKSGLGLASMRERVRLVNGSLSITSQPREGTEVDVEVPLKKVEISNNE